jgi:hypothetical protein
LTIENDEMKIKFGSSIKNQKKIIKIVLLTCLTFVLLRILFTAFVFYQLTYTPSFKFDKKEWKKNEQKRYKYGKDLQESKFLIGLDSIEMVNLIGDATTKWNKKWTYNLGISTKGTGFGIGFNILNVFFKNQIVDSVSFITVID